MVQTSEAASRHLCILNFSQTYSRLRPGPILEDSTAAIVHKGGHEGGQHPECSLARPAREAPKRSPKGAPLRGEGLPPGGSVPVQTDRPALSGVCMGTPVDGPPRPIGRLRATKGALSHALLGSGSRRCGLVRICG